MSDYGASITIKRNDNGPLTSADKDRLRAALDKVQAGNEWTDTLGQDFLFDIDDTTDGGRRCFILLSEYWHGEGNDEENFSFAKDGDLHQAQDLAEKLAAELGDGFTVDADFGEW